MENRKLNLTQEDIQQYTAEFEREEIVKQHKRDLEKFNSEKRFSKEYKPTAYTRVPVYKKLSSKDWLRFIDLHTMNLEIEKSLRELGEFKSKAEETLKIYKSFCEIHEISTFSIFDKYEYLSLYIAMYLSRQYDLMGTLVLSIEDLITLDHGNANIQFGDLDIWDTNIRNLSDLNLGGRVPFLVVTAGFKTRFTEAQFHFINKLLDSRRIGRTLLYFGENIASGVVSLVENAVANTMVIKTPISKPNNPSSTESNTTVKDNIKVDPELW